MSGFLPSLSFFGKKLGKKIKGLRRRKFYIGLDFCQAFFQKAY